MISVFIILALWHYFKYTDICSSLLLTLRSTCQASYPVTCTTNTWVISSIPYGRMSSSWETRRRRVRARPQKANATPPPRKGRRPRWPFRPHAWSDPFTRIGWPWLMAFLFAAMTFSAWRRTEPCVNVTTLQTVVDNGNMGLKEGFYLTVVCPVALNDFQQCLRRGVQKCCRCYTNKASEVYSNV